MLSTRNLKAGDVLDGRYRLERRVGGGGMGDVWEGTDTILWRTVAVKVLLADLVDDRGFRERFRREAQAIAVMKGPGVVEVYDYGEIEHEDAQIAYLIMEFIDGKPLSRLLGLWGKLGSADTLRVVGGVAEALQVAHAAGIVHRDIKPGNILVRDDGSVVLVDFGIARANHNLTLTTTGVVLGTVTYMSPEQAAGENLTAASDLYSLGIVAHQCLAGSPPFKADTPLGVLSAHLRNPPPPLPVDVPVEVTELVRRALEKEPAARWSTAVEFAQACREIRAAMLAAAPRTAPAAAPPRPMPGRAARAEPSRVWGEGEASGAMGAGAAAMGANAVGAGHRPAPVSPFRGEGAAATGAGPRPAPFSPMRSEGGSTGPGAMGAAGPHQAPVSPMRGEGATGVGPRPAPVSPVSPMSPVSGRHGTGPHAPPLTGQHSLPPHSGAHSLPPNVGQRSGQHPAPHTGQHPAPRTGQHRTGQYATGRQALPPRTDLHNAPPTGSHPVPPTLAHGPETTEPEQRPRRWRLWVSLAGTLAVIATVGTVAAARPWNQDLGEGAAPAGGTARATTGVEGQDADEPRPGTEEDAAEPSSTPEEGSANDGTDESPEPSDGTTPSASDPASPSTSPSSSPTPEQATVPGVVGLNEAEARQRIEDADLNTTVVYEGEGDVRCSVIRQSPSAGAKVEPESTVQITVQRAADSNSCKNEDGQTEAPADR